MNLKTRADLERSLVELLAPLESRAAPGGYHLGSAAALYPPKIARMEGWSRCLWGIAPFIAGGGIWPGLPALRETLSRGVDPEDPAYWGDCGYRDQRLVEMAAIALSLALTPEVFWEPLDERTRQNLYRWLSFIETNELPPMNWHFFRLIVQAAFRKLDLPVNAKAEEESFEIIESCYRDDGWYQDGAGGSFDLYNPMGFHFYSLLLVRLGEGENSSAANPPIRRFAERFRDRAKTFGPSFSAWFYHDGSAIPYGRSLTYRFVEPAFFSACAFAGLEVLPWGMMKTIVLQNLRRWYSRPILDAGGLLSVGYAYPNLIMADAYNSPGSPYWALKTYLILALKEDHPFWQAKETPLPPLCVSEKVPGFIVSRSNTDAQLLAAGRYPSFDMNHAAQKYCKFAYSARFGFCVSHSNYNIEKTGCDSALLFSEGDGYWRERREVIEQETGGNWVRSRWQPWADVSVVTVLVRLGDWHIRIHRIQSKRSLFAVEGGFSIPRFNDVDEAPPLRNNAEEKARNPEASIILPWAASRIAALEGNFPGDIKPPAIPRRASLVVPAPNLNVIHPSVAIPVLEGKVEPGTTLWACAVWAGDGPSTQGNNDITEPGGVAPQIMLRGESRGHYEFSIGYNDSNAAVEILV
ncbi:MAG: DUF2264 domain-containing protein [Treponema sp.]|jgi:hypothetical protein|nr:DUF2264 domain-containing protein [Treponema sp.]